MSSRVLLSSGERRAFEFDDDEWTRLRELARQDREAVRCLPPCGGLLVPKTSRRGPMTRAAGRRDYGAADAPSRPAKQ